MRAADPDLTDTEKLDRLRLIRSENVGPVTFRQLLHRYRTAADALDALPMLARRGGRRSIQVAKEEDATREWDGLAKAGGVFLFDGTAPYPDLLSQTEDAPPILSVIGKPDVLALPCLGIVGGRNASIHGRAFATELAGTLGGEGFAIASGMARGIDAAAHGGALSTGTIAVLAGGVDHIYPAENAELYRRIAQDGLIVSEMPFGMQPKAQHFPRRNRIISGLSQGVIVIEARRKSGSLITARFAADQGRDVFAVPGFPQDPRAQGGNDLIKSGAVLVQSADDVIAELSGSRLSEPDTPQWKSEPASDATDADMEAVRTAVIEGLNAVPLPIDALLRSINASPGTVHLVLLEMELAGRVARHPGGRLSLLPGISL